MCAVKFTVVFGNTQLSSWDTERQSDTSDQSYFNKFLYLCGYAS